MDHIFSVSLSYNGSAYDSHQAIIPGYWGPTLVSSFSDPPEIHPLLIKPIEYASTSSPGELVGIVSTHGGAQAVMGGSNFTFSLSQFLYSATFPNELYLIFSLASNQSIDSRLPEIRGNSFLQRAVAAFGYSSPDQKTIVVGLDYLNSDIDINNSTILPFGDYAILVQNVGSQDGKTQISIKRV